MTDVFAEFRDSPVTRLAAMVAVAVRLSPAAYRAAVQSDAFAVACREAGTDPAVFLPVVDELAETRAALRESGLTDEQVDEAVAACRDDYGMPVQKSIHPLAVVPQETTMQGGQ